MKESPRRNIRPPARCRPRRARSTLLWGHEAARGQEETQRKVPHPFRLRRADFPAFRDRFKTPQIFGDLLAWVFAENSRERRTDVTRGRRIFELDPHFRRAGALIEMHRARVMDRG